MRTIIQLSKDALDRLTRICQREKISRAEAIRRAVALYARQHEKENSAIDEGFGLWKGRTTDALSYENQVRKEWTKK